MQVATELAELRYWLGPQKIAYFFHESYLGGATLHLLKHALFIKQAGIKLLLCLPERQKGIKDLPLCLRQYGLKITYLPFSYHVYLIRPNARHKAEAKPIAHWLIDQEVGMVHSVTFMPGVGLACKMSGIPHLATLHQFYLSKIAKSASRALDIIDCIHSSSNRYAAIWASHFGKPARKLCCPVERDYFELFGRNCEREPKSGEPRVILISGTLQERKNQLAAIEAIGWLKKWGYESKLEIIGYDQLRKEYAAACRRAVEDQCLANEVQIYGFVGKPSVFYQEYADILLCASTDESMPQTILQAMAAGVLVVTTAVTGVKENIRDNYNGLLVDGYDALSIARALKRAFDLPPDQVRVMLKNAYDTARLICDPAFVKTELFRIYNKTFKSFQTRRKGTWVDF